MPMDADKIWPAALLLDRSMATIFQISVANGCSLLLSPCSLLLCPRQGQHVPEILLRR
jgi:hypothetical protein